MTNTRPTLNQTKELEYPVPFENFDAPIGTRTYFCRLRAKTPLGEAKRVRKFDGSTWSFGADWRVEKPEEIDVEARGRELEWFDRHNVLFGNK